MSYIRVLLAAGLLSGSASAITTQEWLALPADVKVGMGLDMDSECRGLERLGALAISSYPVRALVMPRLEELLKVAFKEQPTTWNDYGDGWLTMHAGRVWLLISPTRSKEFGGTVVCVIGSLT